MGEGEAGDVVHRPCGQVVLQAEAAGEDFLTDNLPSFTHSWIFALPEPHSSASRSPLFVRGQVFMRAEVGGEEVVRSVAPQEGRPDWGSLLHFRGFGPP